MCCFCFSPRSHFPESLLVRPGKGSSFCSALWVGADQSVLWRRSVLLRTSRVSGAKCCSKQQPECGALTVRKCTIMKSRIRRNCHQDLRHPAGGGVREHLQRRIGGDQRDSSSSQSRGQTSVSSVSSSFCRACSSYSYQSNIF